MPAAPKHIRSESIDTAHTKMAPTETWSQESKAVLLTLYLAAPQQTSLSGRSLSRPSAEVSDPLVDVMAQTPVPPTDTCSTSLNHHGIHYYYLESCTKACSKHHLSVWTRREGRDRLIRPTRLQMSDVFHLSRPSVLGHIVRHFSPAPTHRHRQCNDCIDCSLSI